MVTQTHWVGWPTQLPEGLWSVRALDLQHQAGSGAQLVHHVLQRRRSTPCVSSSQPVESPDEEDKNPYLIPIISNK